MTHIEKLVGNARQSGHIPRLHPNGFVQLDLGPDRRLHVWDPSVELPEPAVRTPIHDHTFAFSSHVFLGRLINTHHVEHVDAVGAHRIFHILPFLATGCETPFALTDEGRYAMEADTQAVIKGGEGYNFPAFEFHDTQVDGYTATVIQVSDFDRSRRARVAVPFPDSPDPSFRRDCVPQEELWRIIDKLCRLPILE